eukprot:EG_transcript_9097
MQYLSQRCKQIPKSTVFSVFTALANEHKAINLGQGFPDYRPDEFVLEAARASCLSDNPLMNQYSRSQGLPHLCHTLAAYYSREFGQPVDAMGEILVTIGATEALFCTVMSLVDPGDEVIVIEPFYDMYPADTIFAGGTPVYVPLHPRPVSGRPMSSADWVLDPKELEAAISPKTKLLMINTPQNVPGKMWSVEELTVIADLAKKHNFLVVADQVYDRLTFDPDQTHVHIATLPGMRERTITIGSAGKTFSVTGWKVGWAIGPREIISALHASHILIPFCSITPLQEAVASALDVTMAEGEDGYFGRLKKRFGANRELLVSVLTEAGLPAIVPQGGYFVVCDIAHIPKERYMDPANDEPADYHFCRWLTKEYGVTCIPLTPFYCPAHHHMADRYVRFAACKQEASIQEAGRRLKGAFTQYLPGQ